MQDFLRDNSVDMRIIKYLDCDGVECQSNRRFKTVDDFINFCQQYRIKWETFKQIWIDGDE